MAAKTRFHRGLTSHFRQHLRQAGIAIDEELAHKLLVGAQVGIGIAQEIIDSIRISTLGTSTSVTRFDLMRGWENDHPGQRPFPKPFAQRILDLAHEVEMTIGMESDPSPLLARIIATCWAELSDDEDLPDFDN